MGKRLAQLKHPSWNTFPRNFLATRLLDWIERAIMDRYVYLPNALMSKHSDQIDEINGCARFVWPLQEYWSPPKSDLESHFLNLSFLFTPHIIGCLVFPGRKNYTQSVWLAEWYQNQHGHVNYKFRHMSYVIRLEIFCAWNINNINFTRKNWATHDKIILPAGILWNVYIVAEEENEKRRSGWRRNKRVKMIK